MALETDTSRLHVAGIVVLDPPEGTRSLFSADTRYAQIRAVIAERLYLVPRLRQRAVRVPFDLQRAMWADDPDLDLDWHVRRAVVDPPAGQPELDRLVSEFMSRPLDINRPLWEMLVVEELAGGRSAVVARLHHAILDGVSGATAMGVFLDLTPRPRRARPLHGAGAQGTGGVPPAPGGAPSGQGKPAPLPSTVGKLCHAAGLAMRQPQAVADVIQRGFTVAAELTGHNRRLSAEGDRPPPALFSGPRTPLNGNVSGERRYASLTVPLADLELVRLELGPATTATVNDVILTAVGGALRRHLADRAGLPEASLVALVPVSTRGRATLPGAGETADVGNYISGMLVQLGTDIEDPTARLAAVTRASSVAKRQERLAGGDLLEGVTRAIPPLVVSAAMWGIGALRLFDRVRPPFNVVVSTLVVPDVPLWWAGCPVAAVFPAGPVADGVGLNVTSMTYGGMVRFGLLACPRLLPDVAGFASLLDDALAELVVAALDAETPRRQGLLASRASQPHAGCPSSD